MSKIKQFIQGKDFEEKLVQALIVDYKFAQQMIEVLEPEHFTLSVYKETVDKYFGYYNKYRTFPTINTLWLFIKDSDDIPEKLKEKIVFMFKRVKSNPLNGDIEYIKEASLEFCKKQTVLSAMESLIDMAEDSDYDKMVTSLQKALYKGSDVDIGHSLDEDYESRWEEEDPRNPLPTPWKAINKITSGGVGAGELCVVLAGTGHGKSHCLVNIGSHLIKEGFNVLHYTFELSEKIVGKRYDACLSKIPFDDLMQNKEKIKKCLSEVKGKVIIKNYSARSATVVTIKNHMNRLALKNFKPDLIILDYADIMKSTKGYADRRFEEGAIYEELRAFANEISVPIWTATQTNRSGMSTEALTLEHVAESFDKAKISDFFITLNVKKTDVENEEKEGKLFIAKSRLGRDGLTYSVGIDTGRSTVRFLSDENISSDGSGLESKKLHDILNDVRSKHK